MTTEKKEENAGPNRTELLLLKHWYTSEKNKQSRWWFWSGELARATDISNRIDTNNNRIDVIQDFSDSVCSSVHMHIRSSVASTDASFYRFARRFVFFDFVEWCVIFINTLMSLQKPEQIGRRRRCIRWEKKRDQNKAIQTRKKTHIAWNWWSTIRRYSCHHL